MTLAPVRSERGSQDTGTRTQENQILQVRNVNKSFQKQRVLEDLNLEIAESEFLTLLGPSGCGKSTSLNIVAGLLQPDSGHLYLRGVLANDLPPRKRRLGMVFQSWALFPHMTVLDNIAYGLRMPGSADAATIRRRVGEMLDLVRLPGIEEKFPSQLSGGMQQRVALARALVIEPDLLLLDEPLSNLDAALRKEMQVELKQIHERLRVTTLLVTHSQEEALVMSNRIAVMRNGRIERIDTPEAIYSDPRTRFVCTFLGEANILEGTVEARDRREARVRVGALELVARADAEWREGGRVELALRPEAISIGSIPGQNGENVWEAEVVDRVFKGSSIGYDLRVGSRSLLVVSLPRPDGRMYARGEKVLISFAPDSVIPLRPQDQGE